MCSEINVRELFQNHTNPSGVLHMSAIKHFVGHLVSTFFSSTETSNIRSAFQLLRSAAALMFALLTRRGGGQQRRELDLLATESRDALDGKR